MQLYFLRHGLAGSKIDWRGDDDERPLVGEPVLDAANAAAAQKALAAGGLVVSFSPFRNVAADFADARLRVGKPTTTCTKWDWPESPKRFSMRTAVVSTAGGACPSTFRPVAGWLTPARMA